MDVQMYQPFLELGALAVFALLMFLMNKALVTKVLNQAMDQVKGALASQERITVLLDNHLTSLHTGQATILEGLRGSVQSLLEHDRREATAWGRLLDRLDSALIVPKVAPRGRKAAKVPHTG